LQGGKRGNKLKRSAEKISGGAVVTKGRDRDFVEKGTKEYTNFEKMGLRGTEVII